MVVRCSQDGWSFYGIYIIIHISRASWHIQQSVMLGSVYWNNSWHSIESSLIVSSWISPSPTNTDLVVQAQIKWCLDSGRWMDIVGQWFSWKLTSRQINFPWQVWYEMSWEKRNHLTLPYSKMEQLRWGNLAVWQKVSSVEDVHEFMNKQRRVTATAKQDVKFNNSKLMSFSPNGS